MACGSVQIVSTVHLKQPIWSIISRQSTCLCPTLVRFATCFSRPKPHIGFTKESIISKNSNDVSIESKFSVVIHVKGINLFFAEIIESVEAEIATKALRKVNPLRFQILFSSSAQRGNMIELTVISDIHTYIQTEGKSHM